MIRNILVYPDPKLQEVSREVVSIGEQEYLAIVDARDTMLANRGVGLAGIQIGESLRFFLMQDEKGKVEVVLNPSYEPSLATRSLMMEGCLSFPGVFEYVKRYKRILATYESFDINSRVCTNVKEVLTGLKAHVFQHESEHLDGMTFISNRFPSEQKAVLHRVQRYLKKQDPLYR